MIILEYYITCYRGRRRSGAASEACRTGPQPASGLATRLGPGAWRPGLPAAATAAAGVKPAGPLADSGRLGEAAVAAAAPGCCCCSGRGGGGGGGRPAAWDMVAAQRRRSAAVGAAASSTTRAVCFHLSPLQISIILTFPLLLQWSEIVNCHPQGDILLQVLVLGTVCSIFPESQAPSKFQWLPSCTEVL